MNHSGTIYEFTPSAHSAGYIHTLDDIPTPASYEPTRETVNLLAQRSSAPAWRTALGSALVAVSLVGLSVPMYPKLKLDTQFKVQEAKNEIAQKINPPKALPPAAPVLLDPLKTPNGQTITPVNTDFAIIVPKLGINSAVIPSVDPLNGAEYSEALKHGVAHAKTSYLPDQNGTMYLFSHSTNYEWFVKDLNAVFYLLKNLEYGDLIVVVYKGNRYTYKYATQKVVDPTETSFLVPESDKKRLILQTCWPPGTTDKRLLIFADLVEEYEGVL